MSDHDHDHGHEHPHAAPASPLAERVKSLEALLVAKKLVDPDSLNALIDTYEHKVGPRNGAKVVARAWVDPAYKERLLRDATAAIAEFGFTGRQGEHMVVVENTPAVHNMVVCTLCSCYPWPVLGLPPVWYKSAPYRSRAVLDPRGVLREFGTVIGDEVEVRVWDSTAELRYLVLPERPAGTEGFSEEQLAELVTRDSMIGVTRAKSAGERAMNGAHDMGGMHGMGPIDTDPNDPLFHAEWERRAFAITLALGFHGRWNIDTSRHARENRHPLDYLSSSYFELWLKGVERLAVDTGMISAEELATGEAGRSCRGPSARSGARGGDSRQGRQREAGRRCAGEVRGRSKGAGARYHDHRPYPRAALLPGPDRHHRPRPRRLHLSRHPRPWLGKEAAALLQRPLQRPRPVGRRGAGK